MTKPLQNNTFSTSTAKTIPVIPSHISFPQQERNVLAFWKEIDAFKTSLKIAEGKPRYSFYDGPPFATGLPHYGHLLAGTIKDTVTRYQSLNGFYVERRAGWDCHGLPIEYEIDKKLDIKGPEDVKAMGIDKYNEECRQIVMRYSGEWEQTVNRMGRWIDFENDYKTLNTSFMESVWWVFQQLFEKNQVYRGFRIMPYSTACSTPLSNFEANLNYKDASDPSVVVSFPLISAPHVKLLAWTTTPWTLPTNLALCVNTAFEYIKIKDDESAEEYILLEKRLDCLYKDLKKAKYTILEKIPGRDLIGLEYKPLFNYYSDRIGKGAFVVVGDSYVSDESGTGIVHQAPGFGEDDLRVCLHYKVIAGEHDVPCPISASGEFTDKIPEYKGMYFKDADKPIQKDLKAMGRLIRQSTITHSYPFCWRSDTPLMYRAVPGWFVRVTNIKDKLIANNLKTYWVPDNVQEKRFANWLENARDWNISRNRYWGTPIPLWVSEDYEEIVVIGSVEELERLSGVSGLTDIHRDKIDHLTIPSRKGKGVLRRVEEVFDCWFESGSMPYAQQHYPFENKELFKDVFPADFIAEGLDQTRGWFYTLLVLSTHLFDQPPFKNLIVNGLILASDGKKMSKRLKNYPDPNVVMETYGADILRLYLINSPVVRAEPLRFKEEGVRELIARVFLPWWNSYRFFFNQCALLKQEHGLDFTYDPEARIMSNNEMDLWVLASTQSLIAFVKEEMAAYRLYTVVPRLLTLIDDLTNVYIRLNRKRLKGENGKEDAVIAMKTLYEVLLTLSRMMAPFTPFLSEAMYQNLKFCLSEKEGEDTRSVHFLTFPVVKKYYFNPEIERKVGRMNKIIDLGRAVREKKFLSLKTPLRELVVVHHEAEYLKDLKSLENYIIEELNIKKLVLTSDQATHGVKYNLTPEHKTLGQKYKKEYPQMRKQLLALTDAQILSFVESGALELGGITLGKEELVIGRYLDTKASSKEAAFDKDVVILLDCTLDEELMIEGVCREIVNRVQRLRKKAGLEQTDIINYFYTIEKDDGELAKAFMNRDILHKSLKQDMTCGKAVGEVILEELQEVNGNSFVLVLVK